MAVENPSIAALLRLTSALDGVSDTPRLDLEVLLCHVLDKPRSYLFTWPEKEIAARIKQLIEREVKR